MWGSRQAILQADRALAALKMYRRKTCLAYPQTPSNQGTLPQFFLFQNGNSYKGSGRIPNEDFKLVGQMLILNTDTSAIPGFDNGGLPGGVISVEWTPINEFSQEFTGQMTTRFGNTVFNFSGKQSTTSAAAKGAFFGASFDTFGEMGVNHSAIIVIERKN